MTVVIDRQKNKPENKKPGTQTKQEGKERQKTQQDNKGSSTQPNPSSGNPYEIFGVPRIATKDQVIEAWRTLSKKYHPDTVTDKEPRVQELFAIEFDKIQKAKEQIFKARGWN